MKAVAPALLYALFVWWFATGLVLLLVLRRDRALKGALAGAALLFPVSLYLLALSSASTSVAGVYMAFTSAIVLWGTQELAFLAGAITGPRPVPCSPGARGGLRFRQALGAILYHEVALLLTGGAVLAATWGAPNQAGALTFAILWAMRVSAKLNLFLGVPVLNDELLPARIDFLRSYFLRGPVNAFFPVAIGLASLSFGALVMAAVRAESGTADEAGYVLLAALMGLAILEHVFMLVPLPIDRLWRWATGRVARASPPSPSQDPRPAPDEIERIVVPSS